MRAGHLPIETRDMGWTSPGRDKRYGLDKARQRQEIWAGQVPAGTRDMDWTMPDRDKRYGLDKSQQ